MALVLAQAHLKY